MFRIVPFLGCVWVDSRQPLWNESFIHRQMIKIFANIYRRQANAPLEKCVRMNYGDT